MSEPSPSGGGNRPWLAFAGCCLIWGSTFLFISVGNDSLEPFWGAALRLMLAAVVLSLMTRAAGHSFPRGPALRSAIQFGVFQFGCNMPLLYWGETRVTSGLTAVLFATIPLSTAFITRAFGMEKLQPLKVAGGVVALAGVALIGGASAGGFHHLGGVVAVLAAATFAGVGTTLLKRGPRQSPLGANAVGNAVGAPICLILSALARETWKLPDTGSGWFAVIYLVLAGSAGAFALMAWLINHWPVTRVAFISVVIPVIALALGSIFRHEPITSTSIFGSLLVLGGLICGMAADRWRGASAKEAAH